MAATVDKRPTTSKAQFDKYGRAFVLESDIIDFTVSANQLAQNETMAVFDLDADVIIENAMVEVLTADTDVTDVDLGTSTDGSTASNLGDGLTLGTTGYKREAAADFGVATASAVQVVFTNIDSDTINQAKIRVLLVCRSIA